MINRRDFLSTTSSLLAYAAITGCASNALADTRKKITIDGKQIKVIDIHAHCLFQEVAPIIKGTKMGNADLSDFLTLSPKRIQQMDARGIDIAALSVNRYWWYIAGLERARQIVQINDEGLADWCSKYPDRFVALSSPAMQHPDLAAEQLEYAVNELGHRGASIMGHVNGEVPTSIVYDPFWAAAEALNVPVFVHPNNASNLLQAGKLDGNGGLHNVIGNPLETAVFLAKMIMEGTLDRFPKLKICAAHGGGYLPSYLGRFEVACDRRGVECANQKKPSEYLKDQIIIDTMVFSEEGLRHLVAEAGASQIVYGSDMPFAWPDTIDTVVNAAFLNNSEKEAILSGNLMKLLNIK